ncbi:MAG: hypothetical protein ABIG39_04905 [Candidatus Micrarchaeota archaeon]
MFERPQVRVGYRTNPLGIMPLTGADHEGGLIYRKSFPGPFVSLAGRKVLTDELPTMQLTGRNKPPSPSTKKPSKKPEPGSGAVKPPAEAGNRKKQIVSGMEEEFPPITPLAALGYTLVISRVSSSDADKRKISHKVMNELADLDKLYRKDERARSFIQAVRTLVLTSGIAIGESNKSLNRKLEKIAECTRDNVLHHRDIRDMHLEYIEKSKTVRTLPSVTAWFASLGISITAIAALKTEAINFVATYYPKVQDIENMFYLAGASLLAGTVLGVRNLLNRLLNRKQEKTMNEFQEKKKKEQDAYRALESRYVRTHVSKSVDTAASVYTEVFKLCEAYYPGYLQVNPQHKEYMEIKRDKGVEEADAHMMEVGRKEAQNRVKKKFFEEKGKDFATLLTNGGISR